MEEEIDLRPYAQALVQYRYWIAVTVIVAGVVALLVSLSLPPVYEATTLIVITSPQQVVLNSLIQSAVDPSFTFEDESIPSLQAYPELATSDEMLRQLLAALDLPAGETLDLQRLRSQLTAEAGNARDLIHLSAKYGDAQTAAHIANTWATLFVTWINETYGAGTNERLAFFEAQLATARVDLETAEEELIAHQRNNQAVILQSRLDTLNRTLTDLLEEQRILTFLLRDAEQLQSQLTNQINIAVAPLAYQLTALSLQSRAYNVQTPTGVELQLAAETSLTGADRNEQLNFLAGLISSLAEKQSQNEAMIATAEPQILVLQQERQAAVTEQQRLQRAQQEALETYTALTRQVDAERISTEDTSGGVSLASSSAVPQRPVGPRVLINVVIAMFTAMALAFGVVVLYQWLRTLEGS